MNSPNDKLSLEELKQRSTMNQTKMLDVERQVTLTEKNWNALTGLTLQNLKQAEANAAMLQTLMTAANMDTKLRQMEQQSQEHLKALRSLTREFVEQVGSLNEQYSYNCDTLVKNSQQALTSTKEQAQKAMVSLEGKAKEAVSSMREQCHKSIRNIAIATVSFVGLAVALCAWVLTSLR